MSKIKLLLNTVLAVAVAFCMVAAVPSTSFAQKKHKHKHHVKKQKIKKGVKRHVKVKSALVRTNRVLKNAKKAVKKGGQGKGLFRSAVVHQRAARKAFRRHNFRLALHLTRESRALARKAMKKNNVEPVVDKAETTEDAEADAEVVEETLDKSKVDELVKEEEKIAVPEDKILDEEIKEEVEEPEEVQGE